MTPSILDNEWPQLSKRITTMSLEKCAALLKEEVSGKKRKYIIERLYGVIRKKLYQRDHGEMHKGRLPKWLSHI